MRKSSRVAARKLKQPAQASRLRPDSSSAEDNDAAGVPVAKRRSVREVRRKPGRAEGPAGRPEQAGAAALTRLSEETESDDAVRRHHARVSERGQATHLASHPPQAKQQGQGGPAKTAGAAVAEARQTPAAAKRPGKMRSLADLLGTAPEVAVAPRPEQQPTGSERGGVIKAAVSNGRAATHSADAGAVHSGRSEPHANGGSARADTAVEQPDSNVWTDAQVCTSGWRRHHNTSVTGSLTMSTSLSSLMQLTVAGVGTEVCTLQPQPDRQTVLDVGCG